MGVFAIVLIGWIFSVCLHEFGHAWVAERGGDYTVREKGYLSMNPVHYADPLMSFILPIVFMALGGIGLPGGAVWINRSLLRSREWNTYVSLAGPLMNLILAIICAVLLKLVLIPHFIDNPATYAVAFLLQLQICSVLLNLIPIPPLDGFQAIEPYIPSEVDQHLRPVRQYGMFVLFIVLWYVPAANHALWGTVDWVMSLLGINGDLAWGGFQAFRQFLHF
ncbi:site-2 protease family protein [Pedosphaera parvula]|uniref:Peptidase M50 n=1 Tax=Pedosphaera parvula (strain Ellin514) TaxID=320771 RepID=B9XQT0_PEDPL|nr:site-2 protease family protein [Pedosphaera parvula]EEF57787.1 peptidase M50 [Pedosphaera parvula Ellin514]